MDYPGFPRSAPNSRSHSRELDGTTGSRSAASTPPPLVPVAAAPKDQTLYESLLRYHNENDSVSTDDSSARRRRNPKVSPAGLKAGDDDEEDDTTEDRKMPAKPIALKTPPANSIPPTTASAAGVSSTASTPKTQPSSARTTVPNRKTFPPSDYVSTPDAPKPGIVHVSEPAIRPDSAMYIAAYGQHPSVAGSVPSPPAPSNGTPLGQQQSRDPYMSLSHSVHAVRNMDYTRPPDSLMRYASAGLPLSDQLLQMPGGAGRPPEHMMNIGNDDHIGLAGQKAKQRNSKSPLRFLGGKRHGSNDKDAHDTTPAGGSPAAANWYGKQYPGSTNINARSSLHATAHSAPSTFNSNARIPTATAIPSLGYPPPTQLMRSTDDNQTVITEASMDEELRLALEISKQDTGSHHPPRPTPPPAPRPVPRAQDNNFRQDAMNQARQSSNSSLADLLLALKLSAEESGLDRRASTNLDELLAFEMSQDSRQHMTDFVAAGITTSSSASTANSTNATSSNSSTTYMSSTPIKPKTNLLNSTGSGTSNNPDEQFRILEKIREEREQRELEIALKVSERERGSSTKNHPPLTQKNYLHSQQRAMEDWNRSTGATAGTMSTGARPSHQRQNSISSIDSEGRRQQLLERGTTETKQAIRSGQAHVVTCLGCGGRLQAPMSYSLVFCPKCHTISPA